jgi:hypothetical protein
MTRLPCSATKPWAVRGDVPRELSRHGDIEKYLELNRYHRLARSLHEMGYMTSLSIDGSGRQGRRASESSFNELGA